MRYRLKTYLRNLRWWWLRRPKWNDTIRAEDIPVSPEVREAMKNLDRAMVELGKLLRKSGR
jgi:hypothetical protein